jgi:hypothetical protein
MNRNIARILSCVLALSATPVFAGALASDPNSYLGAWSGSTSFQGYDYSVDPPVASNLIGYVDYAVYAPGQFALSFPGSAYNGFAPTNTEYVYAYQAFETGSAPLSSLSIALGNTAEHQLFFTGVDAANAIPVTGITPSSMSLSVANGLATWNFDGPSVLQGQSSVGLVFTSPFAPVTSQGTTIDDGTVGLAKPLPSPGSMTGIPNTPEPGTMTLALCAAGAFALYRWRNRRGN